MADRFQGKTAMITGAASGIGAACAHLLAKEGVARLILIDTNATGLDDVANAIGAKAAVLAGDITDQIFWDTATPMLKGLELVVANAGVAGNGEIATHDFAEWRRIMSVNLDGTFLTLRTAMSSMRQHGRGGAIVVTSSASGLKAEPGTAAYGASKAAIIHLARTAAKEGAEHGIRVNAIAPAGVETPMWRGVPFFRDLVDQAGNEDAAFAAIAANTPLGRFATANEIAEQIGFLLSDAAATVTGTTLISDGGYTL